MPASSTIVRVQDSLPEMPRRSRVWVVRVSTFLVAWSNNQPTRGDQRSQFPTHFFVPPLPLSHTFHFIQLALHESPSPCAACHCSHAHKLCLILLRYAMHVALMETGISNPVTKIYITIGQ
jgi:hypothetical protein